jgi:hypothetical protein
LKDFGRLEEMIEECIDMKKARQNEYLINPSFSPVLRELNLEINKVKARMESMKHKVSTDLGTTKAVNLVESTNYGFVFEGDKKECDAGIRNSKSNYKTINCKQRIMSFTSHDLKDLVREYQDLEERYR